MKPRNLTQQESACYDLGAAAALRSANSGLHDVALYGNEHVHVEVMRTPSGRDVVYIHVDGMTVFRLSCPAIAVVNRRNRPKTYNSKYRRQPFTKKGSK